MYGIPLYIVQILMNFQNLCLNSVILEGGSFSFKKKLPQIKLILRNWEILVQIEKIICLNCKDGGEGSTRTKIVSIKIVSIGLKGGAGKVNWDIVSKYAIFFFGGFPKEKNIDIFQLSILMSSSLS